jgi:hypothetical protein
VGPASKTTVANERQDAVLFATGVRPPPHVPKGMFGDPDHVITGRVVWTEPDPD